MQAQSGETLWLRAPGIPELGGDAQAGEQEPQLDASFTGFFRLEKIVFPFPSPLVMHADKQPRARMRVVARSSPRSTVDASPSIALNLSTSWKPSGDFGPRAVAITLEGPLRSAFTGRPGLGVASSAESAGPGGSVN